MTTERELWEAISNISAPTKDKRRVKVLEIRLDAIRVLAAKAMSWRAGENDNNQQLVAELEDTADLCGRIAQISAYMNICEICNECGESTVFGSGNYINRILDGNSIVERAEDMGKPFPVGDYICIECEQDRRK